MQPFFADSVRKYKQRFDFENLQRYNIKKEVKLLYCSLDFLVGKLNCRIISIQSKNRFEKSDRYYDHNHFCTELHWIETGSCDYICDKTRHHIDAGRLVIIPPLMYHRTTNFTKDFKRLSILIDINPKKENSSVLDSCFCETFRPKGFKIVPVGSQELIDLLTRITRIINSKEIDSISMERLRIICNSFFVELFAEISGDNLKSNEATMQNDFIEDLVLENHIAHQFMPGASFSTLAKQLHVSPRQLHRIITQKYGVNYRDKIKEIRIEIATNFLCNTNMSIAQIAELMGYSDTSSFSSFIKKATGKSPQQIRKRIQ